MQRKKQFFNLILIILFGLILASCNNTQPPGEYDTNEVGKVKKVIPGTIISKRPVHLRNMANMNNTTSNTLVDSGYSQTRGVEYVVKLNSGSIISVVQSEDLKLKNKQKILVIYGKHTRVVADNGSDIF